MATVQQPVTPQKPKKSWFGRNWWWVLLLILLGGGLLCAGLCSGFAYWNIKKVRDSEAYKLTIDAVSKDPVILEKLGDPIKPPPIAGGSVGETDAILVFAITGPKGTATVASQGRKANGKWGLTQIEVTFADRTKHNVTLGKAQAGGLDEAPTWSPPGEAPQNPTP
jgi:hypothetical protein